MAHHPSLGPPPDLTARYALKSKYARLQKAYFRALETRKDLTLEVSEKEEKVQRLQDEVDLVIDQIYDSDYAHLKPEEDDLFSDEGEDEGDGPSGERHSGRREAADGQGQSMTSEMDAVEPPESHELQTDIAPPIQVGAGAEEEGRSNGSTSKG